MEQARAPDPFPLRFEKACRYMDRKGPGVSSMGEDETMALYALRQQANHGANSEPRPSSWFGSPVEREKWDAWNQVKDLPQMDSMYRFTELMAQLVPQWANWEGIHSPEDDEKVEAAATETIKNARGGMGRGSVTVGEEVEKKEEKENPTVASESPATVPIDTPVQPPAESIPSRAEAVSQAASPVDAPVKQQQAPKMEAEVSYEEQKVVGGQEESPEITSEDLTPPSLDPWLVPEFGWVPVHEGGKQSATQPSARYRHTICSVGRMVFAYGGINSARILLPGLWQLDTSNMEWSCLDNGFTSGRSQEHVVPSPRVASTLVPVAGGTGLMLFGGQGGKGQVNDCLIFDLATNKWVQPTVSGALPSIRSGHTASVVDEEGTRVLVFGGMVGEDVLHNDLHVAEVVSTAPWALRWVAIPTTGAVPSARRDHAAAVLCDHLVLFGGITNSGEYTNDLHALNLRSLEWADVGMVVEREGGVLPSKRAGHSSCVLDDQMLVFGGGDGVHGCQDTWIFNFRQPASPVVLEMPDSGAGAAPSRREGHAITTVAAGSGTHFAMVLIGGYDGQQRNDVWARGLPASAATLRKLGALAFMAARWQTTQAQLHATQAHAASLSTMVESLEHQLATLSSNGAAAGPSGRLVDAGVELTVSPTAPGSGVFSVPHDPTVPTQNPMKSPETPSSGQRRASTSAAEALGPLSGGIDSALAATSEQKQAPFGIVDLVLPWRWFGFGRPMVPVEADVAPSSVETDQMA